MNNKNPMPRKKEFPVNPKIPEIIPNPKERPVIKHDEPDKIPPDLNPGESNPEIIPVKSPEDYFYNQKYFHAR